MKTQLFRFFDQSPYKLHPVFWIHGGIISRAVDRVYGSNAWRVFDADGRADEHRISITKEAFAPIWEKACIEIAAQARLRGDLVYMDLEHLPYRFGEEIDYRFVFRMAELMRRHSPGLRIATYFAFVADFLNNDWIIRYDQGTAGADYDAHVAETRKVIKPLFDLMDYIDISAYLLGAACFDRDIACIQALRRISKRFYPGKKIIFSAWGRYHDAYNPTPAEFLIPKDRLLSYAKVLTRYGDDVIVFAEEASRDDYFMEQLKLRSE